MRERIFRAASAAAFLAVASALFLGNCASAGPKVDPELRQKVEELRRLAQEKKAQGCDITAAIELERRAREAVGNDRLDEARRLVDEALAAADAACQGQPAASAAAAQTAIGAAAPVELPVTERELVLTEAVPLDTYEKGSAVGAYRAAFAETRLAAANGRLALALGDKPVFLEPPGVAAPSAAGGADTPFGLLDTKPDFGALGELGVGWIRLSGLDGLIWGLAEPERGRFDFEKLDRQVRAYRDNGLELVVTVSCFNPWDQFGPEDAARMRDEKPVWKLPKDLEAYSRFLERAVERYDGDGVDDAPGSPVVAVWQIQNEPDIFWKDTPENYAELLKVSSRAVRRANPRARVMIAGLARKQGLEFYETVIGRLRAASGGERYFDAMDLHWLSTARGYANLEFKRVSYNLGEAIDRLRSLLDANGYAGVPIVITEMSTYSGCPVSSQGGSPPCQSEREQAIGLVKMVMYALSKRVERVFWVGLEEFHNFAGKSDGYFDHVGLVNNPDNHGLSGRKLAFFAYRKLIEKTRGVDWKTLERIDTGDRNLYVFKMKKLGQPLYVVWRDQP